MSLNRSFEKILLALHMREEDLSQLITGLDLASDAIPVRDACWGYIPKPDEEFRLLFGPAGLKRVYAPELIQQLASSGYVSAEYVLARKPDTYSKKEARRARREGHPDAREGMPKYGPSRKRLWKQCLEISFSREGGRIKRNDQRLLGMLFEQLIWKRGRGYEVLSSDNDPSVIIELVMPLGKERPDLTRLNFDARQGFDASRIFHRVP